MRFLGFCHPAKTGLIEEKPSVGANAFRSYQTGTEDEGVVKAHPRPRPSVNIIKPPREEARRHGEFHGPQSGSQSRGSTALGETRDR